MSHEDSLSPWHHLAVVGTDTGVGKTSVSLGLIHGLRQRNLSVSAFKPVETGVPVESPSPDASLLARACGLRESQVLGVSFPLPASPLAAARRAGGRVSIEELDKKLRWHQARSSRVVVEGAGGLLVPFAEGVLWADLLRRWRLGALVVGRLGLGTINHTLLTLEALERRAVPVLGLVLCGVAPPGPEEEDTPGLICEFYNIQYYTEIPHGEHDQEAISRRLEACGLLSRISI